MEYSNAKLSFRLWSFFVQLSVCVALLTSCEGTKAKKRERDRDEYVDLSYSISNRTIFYPGAKPFTLFKDYEGWKNDGAFWYSSYSFTMGEHGGTHLDSPFHFYKEGWTVDQIPQSLLVDIPTRVIDVEPNLTTSGLDGNYKVTVEDLIEHERRFEQPIEGGSLVLIHTGWSKFWPDRKRYLGIEEGQDEHGNNYTNLRFPGLSEEAIRWLVDERQIVGVGIDTASVDQGMDKRYPVHVYAASQQTYNLENVANLHLLLETKKVKHSGIPFIPRDLTKLRAFLLPLKIIEGTGSPARILVRVPHL